MNFCLKHFNDGKLILPSWTLEGLNLAVEMLEGGLEHGLDNRAEKCFDHQMSQGKNLLHTNTVFLQTESTMHYEYKIFNSSLGIIISNLVKMAIVLRILKQCFNMHILETF